MVQEFNNTKERTIRYHVVSNEYTLTEYQYYPRNLWAPEDITDYRGGGGTAMASVVGGRIHGVASKANLVIVKIENAIFDTTSGKYEPIEAN